MLETPKVNDPRVYNKEPKQAMANVVRDKILMCRSNDRI
jgi:tagatose 1,6-diphosphate aldolase GatY/KbaY